MLDCVHYSQQRFASPDRFSRSPFTQDLFARLMAIINEFKLAFYAKLAKLPSMKFTAHYDWWRFTYRTNNRQRGAIV
jgi:hypothetical protein